MLLLLSLAAAAGGWFVYSRYYAGSPTPPVTEPSPSTTPEPAPSALIVQSENVNSGSVNAVSSAVPTPVPTSDVTAAPSRTPTNVSSPKPLPPRPSLPRVTIPPRRQSLETNARLFYNDHESYEVLLQVAILAVIFGSWTSLAGQSRRDRDQARKLQESADKAYALKDYRGLPRNMAVQWHWSQQRVRHIVRALLISI